MDVRPYVAAVGVGTYLIVFGIVSRKRSRAIRALALRLGFSYLGKAYRTV